MYIFDLNNGKFEIREIHAEDLIAFSEKYLIAFGGNSEEFYVFDISDPLKPVYKGIMESPDTVYLDCQVIIEGDSVFVFHKETLYQYDISGSPVLKSSGNGYPE